jgi:serine/threonine protein kinase
VAAGAPFDDPSAAGPGTVPALEHRREAEAPSDEAPRTGPGTVLGTPDYMAPEQSRGAAAQADERSDVFALGAILRFLLTGSPVPGESKPAATATTPPRVPPALAAICRRAMALEPERRYPGAAELAADLARFLAGLPVDVYPETLARRAWRVARRHATPLLLLLTYLLVRVLLLVLARHR